jgi:hypothetical protein
MSLRIIGHSTDEHCNGGEPCEGDGAAVVVALEWKLNCRRPHIANVRRLKTKN